MSPTLYKEKSNPRVKWVKTTYVDRHGREEHVFRRVPVNSKAEDTVIYWRRRAEPDPCRDLNGQTLGALACSERVCKAI